MLETLRKGAASWVARIFLGVLVVSFAIWGIGDIFRNFNRENFARVGTIDLSAEAFRLAYDRERQLLSRQSGRAVSNEQARALGLHNELVQRMVTEAAFDERAREMTLGVSESELARSILQDPNFSPAGASGFSRQYFEQLLRENGLSEASYVTQRRALTLRRQIAEAVTGSFEAPVLYRDIVNTFANERRSAIYFILPREQFAKVEAPDDQTLQSYYELVRAAFRTTPRRTAEVLSISIADVAKTLTVSDDDARYIYDSQRSRFGTPEKRRLLQLSFANQEAAMDASAKLNEGLPFDILVEALGQKPADIDLGLVSEKDLVDPAVRKIAFALAPGRPSEVIVGNFGPVIIYVQEIEGGNVTPFETASVEIKAGIARDRAQRAVLDIVDKVEDDRAGGARLGEIAGKHQLPFKTLTGIDREGVDENEQDRTSEAGGRQVIDAIFRSAAGSDSDPLRLADGGYSWIDVREIIADRERPLADVKDQVIARWTDEKERSALLKSAEEAMAQIKSGLTIDQVAASLNLETRQSSSVSRNAPLADFSRNGALELFRVAKGNTGTALAENSADRIVFVVSTVEPPAAQAPSDQKALDDLRENLKNDVLTAYITQIEQEIGVRINRTVIDRLSQGGGS